MLTTDRRGESEMRLNALLQFSRMYRSSPINGLCPTLCGDYHNKTRSHQPPSIIWSPWLRYGSDELRSKLSETISQRLPSADRVWVSDKCVVAGGRGYRLTGETLTRVDYHQLGHISLV